MDIAAAAAVAAAVIVVVVIDAVAATLKVNIRMTHAMHTIASKCQTYTPYICKPM